MDSAFAYLRNKSHRNSLILIVVLLLGLIVGLILIRNPQIFRPRASADSIEVQLGDNVKVVDNEKVVVPPVNYQPGATIPIKIKLTSPFGSDGNGVPAPSEPTVSVDCTNGAQASIAWAGNPGQGADADTANKGKTGFYVDISPNQNFDPTYNKFIETTGTSTTTTAPTGFVYTNAGRPETGSAMALSNGTYYVRVFNGAQSSVKSFSVNCSGASATASPTPGTLTLNAVATSCDNSNPQAAISWTGTPGKGADADTANKGKTGFYVDISPNQNFDLVYNKFVESSQSTVSTAAPLGFVLANSGSTNPPTGSPLSFTNGTTYYVRAFNGAHSNVQSFVASCTTGGTSGNVTQAEAVISNWGKTVSPGTAGDISNNDGLVNSLDFEQAYKSGATSLKSSFNKFASVFNPNNLISEVNAQTADLSKKVNNCKGENKSLGDLRQELTTLGWNFSLSGPLDTEQQILDGYNRTACPTGVTDGTKIQTCNGPRSIAEMTQELKNAGYNGSYDSGSIQNAYFRTIDCSVTAVVNSDGTVTTCKEQRLTVSQLDGELRSAGYDFTGKNLQTRLKDYNQAACPLGKLTNSVETCKVPLGLGGPRTVGALMTDLRAANFPDQGFRNTTLQQAIIAYNNAQPDCVSVGLVGYNDDQYNNCQVRGWAAKPTTGVATQVNVKLYRGDKTDLITTVKADKPRSDLSTSRPELRGTNFGFEFTLPDSFRGTTTPVFAYAVDPSNAANEVKLSNNPRNITCTAGTSTAAPTPTVSPTPANVVGYYKLIESDGGTVVYEDTAWKPLTSSPLTIDHGISGNPGEKTITVIFKSVDGRTETRSTKIKVISISPEITNLTCNLDQASGSILFEARGKNFNTNSKIYVKEGTTNKELDRVGTPTVSLIKGTYKTSDISKENAIIVGNPDGRFSNEVKCKTGSKAFQLRANVFCQQIWPFDVEDVEMTFVDRSAAGSKATEKVTITKDGFIKDIKSKLQPGRNYAVAVKAPKSLRRVVNFTASEGTDVIDNLLLPVGDIWGPNGRPDGVINSNDRGRFNEDWRVLTEAPDIRLSDFNRDKRVNSFDWACMRQGFNESDDPIPGAGATANYKFEPAAPNAGQKVKLTVDNVSLGAGTYDYIALRVKPTGSQPEKYLWFKKQNLSTQGPPFFWESDDERNTKLLGTEAKFYDLSANGEYTFQMVAHCKYPANEDTAFPDCSQADIFFNEVTLTIGQVAAPSTPTVQTSCTNNVPTATFSWTGTPGKGADADTANKGKTGFYVDISTTPTFDLVYNKFFPEPEVTVAVFPPRPFQTTSSGFVLANSGMADTGSSLALTSGTKYYVRVFNGRHSEVSSFTPVACAVATPSPTPSVSPSPTPAGG